MRNKEVAEHLLTLAKLKYLDGASPFAIKAFEHAAWTIQNFADDIETINPESLSGIGKSIALEIREFLKRGTSGYFQKLASKYPVEALTMTVVDGVGPKKAMLLHEKGFRNFSQLLEAANNNLLDNRLRNAVLFANSKSTGRIPYNMATNIANIVLEELLKVDGVVAMQIAGSIRRKAQTVKDIDIAACVDNDAAREALFKKQASLGTGFTGGEAKGSVKVVRSATGDGRNAVAMQVDLWIGGRNNWGALLNHCTGSKEHNIAIRSRAKTFGYTVNEYGIFDSSGCQLGGQSEHDLYRLLNLRYYEPENRTGVL